MPGEKRGDNSPGHHTTPELSAPVPPIDWETLLDDLPYGLIVLGPRQEILHENALGKKLLGYSAKELGSVGKWLEALCPDEEHRDKVILEWQEKIWRNQQTRIFTLKGADQKVREIEFRSSLQTDGGITLTVQDVTESQRDRTGLQIGKLKFRALFSHSRTGTVLVDRTGRVINANPAFVSLSGNTLQQLRLTTLSALIHPEDAENLKKAEEALDVGNGAPYLRQEVWLRTADGGEKKVDLTYCPVGENPGKTSMGVYLFEIPGQSEITEKLAARLRTVAVKAQSLLTSVPDLIFLIDTDLKIADFAPPPKPWVELTPEDSWRGRPVTEVWPVFGELVESALPKIQSNGQMVHADISGTGSDPFQFEVTLSSCGDDQLLAVVRNNSELHRLQGDADWQERTFVDSNDPVLVSDERGMISRANPAAGKLIGVNPAQLTGKRLGDLFRAGIDNGRDFENRLSKGLESGNTWQCAESVVTAEGIALDADSEFVAFGQAGNRTHILTTIRRRGAGAPDGNNDSALSEESSQHHFRNQLQLVTSLFSLEPQGKAAQEAFLKWQTRLRSLAQSFPYGNSSKIWVLPLLRQIADEVCSLTGHGPGRREVIVTGPEQLQLEVHIAAPFSLLIGEFVRLVVSEGQPGPGPELYFHIDANKEQMRLAARPGVNRKFSFLDRESELETMELLAEQIQGRLLVPDEAEIADQWQLFVPLNEF